MQKTALLFTVILLNACTDSENSINRAENSSGQHWPVSAARVDPCNIVLTPLDLTQQDDVITRLQQSVLRNPQSLPRLEKLGWAYVAKARSKFDPGYYRLADQVARCIEKKHPASPEALLLQGHVLHNIHRFSEAEAIARRLIAQRGLWFEYALLGDVLMEQGQLNDAADAYQVMMDKRPGPQAYSRAAHLRWLKGDLAGAVDMMQMTVQATGSRAGEAAAWAIVRLGLYVFQAGNFQDALDLVNHALSLHGNHAPALYARGRILLAQNKPDAAVESLIRAVGINPLPEYQWLLIDALYADQKPDQARQVETRLMHTGAGVDRRTYALYLATTRQQPALASQLAEQDYKTRHDVFSHDAIAWTFQASNRTTEALQHIRLATAEGTQDARLFFHAAVISKAAGDQVQAIRWYKRAKAIQHMLLPSERILLDKEFAPSWLQTLALVTNKSGNQDH